MTEQRRPSIPELLADEPLITGAIQRAAREAALRHARAGNPVATMRDGQVVWLQPAEVFALLGVPPDRPAGS